MTTDYRAMCAELLAALKSWSPYGGGPLESDEAETEACLINRARALLAQPVAHIIRTDQDETGPYVLVAQSKSNVPTAAELRQVFLDQSGYVADEQAMLCDDFYAAARAVLARWGNSQGILDSSPQPVPPSGYAYRYPDGIRFNGGQNVNGCRPSEVIPYWFSQIPANALPTPESNAQ